MRPLVLRLHFYAGALIAPFLLVAAVSGTLYAATPQLEQLLYRDQLHATPTATQVPLATQIQTAVEARGGQEPVAVRPAPTTSETTRVLFSEPTLGESERTAVFIDPGTGQVRGELTAYGTSGILPLRTWVDQLHRNLHLGEPGRLYSELAASWLWVLALSGLGLWIARQVSTRRTARADNSDGSSGDGSPASGGSGGGPVRRVLAPGRGEAGKDAGGRGSRGRTRTLHAVVGTWIAVGLIALSATGLTWSSYAGAHVDALRGAFSWSTPAVDTTLPEATGLAAAATGHEDHAGHEGHANAPTGDPGISETEGTAAEGVDAAVASAVTPAAFAQALATARQAGLTAGKIEVKAPAEAGASWKVDEIDRGLHTQVDSAAVAVSATAAGGMQGQVLDVVRFADYPFMAKLARWGIDLHMGSFGLGNQLVLLALGLGLSAVIVWGYRMWWQRRLDPARRLSVGPPAHRGAWRYLPKPVLALVVVLTVAIGWALPLLGVSLLVFLVLDVVLGAVHRSRSRGAGAGTSGPIPTSGGLR
ncbi:PepSY-associated TM helix domain-containing protein [Kineococcus sp. R86509]|uniref:PepSY-associated TM helix domain-containing protein n=1 Tax=Kineococcus sp. R86509 TaxID=3093851 RepID=UPI0036D26EAE